MSSIKPIPCDDLIDMSVKVLKGHECMERSN